VDKVQFLGPTLLVEGSATAVRGRWLEVVAGGGEGHGGGPVGGPGAGEATCEVTVGAWNRTAPMPPAWVAALRVKLPGVDLRLLDAPYQACPWLGPTASSTGEGGGRGGLAGWYSNGVLPAVRVRAR
jgi:hypothetical protein